MFVESQQQPYRVRTQNLLLFRRSANTAHTTTLAQLAFNLLDEKVWIKEHPHEISAFLLAYIYRERGC